MNTSLFPFSPKQAAQRMLENLPDDASFEHIQYELYVLEKIAAGAQSVERGESVPLAEVYKHLDKTLRLDTQNPEKL